LPAANPRQAPAPSSAWQYPNGDWPQWRGLARDGQVKWLPERLPESPEFVWTAELTGKGIGGISVAEGRVVAASRDLTDQFDVIQCFDASTGRELWKHIYSAKGNLDYGNSPRASPLIDRGHVYVLGAFGDLHCIEMDSGLTLWNRNLIREMDARELTWGHSGSPLIVADKLIVQPGGESRSLLALEPESGDVIWECPGGGASYSSFMPLEFAGKQYVVGYDSESLGGWDVETGERIWTYVPLRRGDFNVPTVLIEADSEDSRPRLILSSENNGTRILRFTTEGIPEETMYAESRELSPDTSTPVLFQGLVVGVYNSLIGLNVGDQFETLFELNDEAFSTYCSLVASKDRLLVLNLNGELLLIEKQETGFKVVSRLQLDVERGSVYSHPAVADEGLYMRLETKLVKMQLRNRED
jgi:outer membrane protein assembly factor BamB